MYLTYNDLTIRSAAPADCEQLAAWWNDGKVMAHAGFPNGLGTTAEKVARQISTDTDDTRRRLVIEYGGKLIGETSYTIKDDTAEIGIKICDFSQQNRGLGRQCLSMLITALFEKGCKKIILDTNLKNLRAQHVYESLGFRKVRINVDAWVDQVGVAQTSVDYELLPEEFHSFLQ